ncbi:hypothetical protein BD410DRAFT_141369 [Rickenella mellea]|uniref:RING-type domain-containing protein n=1 Tax=Rickenella mellea TaxID=50990 RepID=A0A4Y7Q8Z5_9AGAM|nr:hypothetical protein BD410DRAFT_141369 [Rickenella mellea]
MSCSICLGRLRAPVATPCGHLHCGSCIASHVESSPDVAKTFCPTCRADFNTVSPDLEFVPKKYHPFILPTIRRVYVDDSNEKQLKAKATRLESRIKSLERDKDDLMKRCESLISTSETHAKNEQSARLEAERASKDVAEYRKKYNSLKVKYNSLRSDASSSCNTSASSIQLQLSAVPRTSSMKRKSFGFTSSTQEEQDTSEGGSFSLSRSFADEPVTKRTRYSGIQQDRPSHVAPPPIFRKPSKRLQLLGSPDQIPEFPSP